MVRRPDAADCAISPPRHDSTLTARGALFNMRGRADM
jgi:hypothetical protein